MLYLITYDITQPGRRDYRALHNAIKEYNSFIKPLESVWFINTTQSPAEIKAHLRKHMDATDRLLIISVKAPGSLTGNDIADGNIDWLNQYLP